MPCFAWAESLQWHGFELSADRLSQIEGGGVKVEALGSSRIVGSDDAARTLALMHLGNKEAAGRIPSSVLVGAVKEELSDLDLSTAILNNLLRRLSSDGEMVERAVIDIGSDSRAAALFKSYLSDGVEQDLSPLIIMAAAESDPIWTKSRAIREIIHSRGELARLAGRWCARTASAGDISRSEKIIAAARVILGEDSQTALSLALAGDKIKKIYSDYAAGRFHEISLTMESAARNQSVLKITAPAVREILERGAAEALGKGEFDNALSLIAKIAPENSSPRSRALIITALSRIDPTKSDVVIDKGVFRCLAELASEDAAVMDVLVRALESASTTALLMGDPAKSDRFFEKVDSLRPDRSTENDSLRLSQARLLSRLGLRDAAHRKIDEMERAPSFGDKIGLLAAGYYGRLRLIISLILIPVLSAALVYVRGADKKSSALSGNLKHGESEPEAPRFVVRGQPPSLRLVEYRGLLESFGLGSEAPLSEIKSAYRTMVKEVHPDSSEGESSERFIRLNGIYKRILELRQELGLDAGKPSLF